MFNTIFKMKNLSDFSYFFTQYQKSFSHLKIFGRIFMSQISLTDYFAKVSIGVVLNQAAFGILAKQMGNG